jgi:hypothetical protein
MGVTYLHLFLKKYEMVNITIRLKNKMLSTTERIANYQERISYYQAEIARIDNELLQTNTLTECYKTLLLQRRKEALRAYNLFSSALESGTV